MRDKISMVSPKSNRKPTDGIRRRENGVGNFELAKRQEQPVEVEHDEGDIFQTQSRREGDLVITERMGVDQPVEPSARETEVPLEHNVFASPDDNRFVVLKKWFGGKKGTGIIDGGVVVTEWKDRGGRRLLRLGIMGGCAVTVILIVVFSTVFARVTITVTPRIDTIPVEDRVVALDTSVSKTLAAQGVVPVEYLTFSRTVGDEFEATGSQFVEEKARGLVRVYNRFSSSPQTLVSTTRFVTDGGVLYRLPSTIRIPGAEIVEGKIVPQLIEVELTADEPGEGSNYSGEVNLTILGFKGTPKYAGFFGTAPHGFEGGFRGTAQVVASDDIKRAQEQVTKRVVEELKQEVVQKIPPDFKLIEALQEVQVSRLDTPSVGSRARRFVAETEAKVNVFVFRETDITEFLKATMLGGDVTKEIVDGAAEIRYRVRTVDFRKGRAELVVQGALKARSVVPHGELVEFIKGKKEGSIVEFLKSVDRIARFQVKFFPPWRSRAPDDAQKIRIIVDES